MDINKLKVGDNPPEDVNVIIEIPLLAEPVKYEFDKESGFIFVDRLLNTSMHYPCNYGFIPHTISDDGDPIDVLVVTDLPLLSGSFIQCRPVGVLIMEDEAGRDEKLLSVPVDKVCFEQSHIKEPSDISEVLLNKISHFFEHYKDLEKGKWAKTEGIEGSAKAKELILEGIESHKNVK
jgi:inorganic pyrophosphatase|tara:strand:- start:3260 stop:3793 length:534 start_codon:yes stop_codon:yes gene_type:complete